MSCYTLQDVLLYSTSLAMLKLPTKLEEAFDFSVVYVTPDEVMQIRDAVQNGLLGIPAHATFAATDDAITIKQISFVIINGTAVSKDLISQPTRVAGINFEGRSGGKRRLRVKVSWDAGYYIVTVHLIQGIKRNSRVK